MAIPGLLLLASFGRSTSPTFKRENNITKRGFSYRNYLSCSGLSTVFLALGDYHLHIGLRDYKLQRKRPPYPYDRHSTLPSSQTHHKSLGSSSRSALYQYHRYTSRVSGTYGYHATFLCYPICIG